MSGRRPYAGVMKYMLQWPGYGLIQDVIKVKAHQDIDSIGCPVAKVRAIGNDHADKGAKEALGLHPSLSEDARLEVEASIDRAVEVCKTIAKTLGLWPPLKRSKNRLPRSVQPKRHSPAVGGEHSWAYSGGLWRCSKCLHISHVDARGARKQDCKGLEGALDPQALEDQGHRVVYLTCEGVPLYICVKCGAWTSKRPIGLLKDCGGVAGRAGAQALARVTDEKVHPKRDLKVDQLGVEFLGQRPEAPPTQPSSAASRLQALRERVKAKA